MLTFLIGCLISAAMAEILSASPIKAHVLNREYDVRPLIYFIPIWFMLVFKWNSNPDVTFPTGSYYLFFHDAVTTTSFPLGRISSFIREPLSWGLIWFLAKSDFSYFWMLAVIATIFSVSYAIYIDKLSLRPSISILFFALLRGPTIVGALRQAMSIPFLLIAYATVLGREKLNTFQWLKIIISLLLGGLFHQSCFLMLSLFFLANIPLSRKFALFVLVCAILSFPFISGFIKWILSFSRWAGSVGGRRANFTVTLTLLSCFTFLVMLVFYPQMMRLNGGKWAFTLMTGFFILMLFSQSLIDSSRLLQCFTPAMIIIVPNLIRSLRIIRNRQLVLMACLLVFGIFYSRYVIIKTNYHYYSVFFVSREDVFELK